jgi:hypothetical protein
VAFTQKDLYLDEAWVRAPMPTSNPMLHAKRVTNVGGLWPGFLGNSKRRRFYWKLVWNHGRRLGADHGWREFLKKDPDKKRLFTI